MNGTKNMKRKETVNVLLVGLICLPLLVAFTAAASHQIRRRNNGGILSSGEQREYLLYVPKSYDSSRPAPLVISMHGAGGWPALQRDVSRWNRLADRHGFIVVYPSGVDGTGPRIWRVQPGSGLAKDVRYIEDLIDALEASYDIDPRRIYANGLSNGGGMSFVLSCALPDRIAAIGMVAAAQTLPWEWCADPEPVPMITFHGTADSIVPYGGGTSWVGPMTFPDIPTWTENWAGRNRCKGGSFETAVAKDVTRRDYDGCVNGADVVLYTVEGGGHTWPGGEPLPEWFAGPTTSEIDASELMWEFFQKHPLRRLDQEIVSGAQHSFEDRAGYRPHLLAKVSVGDNRK